MCVIVVFKKSDLTTPRELNELIKIPIESMAIPKNYKLNLDKCLCQIDLRKTFKENNIDYLIDVNWNYTIRDNNE